MTEKKKDDVTQEQEKPEKHEPWNEGIARETSDVTGDDDPREHKPQNAEESKVADPSGVYDEKNK